MNIDFIYFKELILNNNNKLTLDFSDEEFVLEINFSTHLDYYISSLDCKLILKNIVHDIKNDNRDRKKLIEELSKKSRPLLEKGTDYQNDIGWLNSITAPYFNFSEFGLTYNFITYPKITDENSFKYKFYDTVEKSIRDCKIYLPF